MTASRATYFPRSTKESVVARTWHVEELHISEDPALRNLLTEIFTRAFNRCQPASHVPRGPFLASAEMKGQRGQRDNRASWSQNREKCNAKKGVVFILPGDLLNFSEHMIEKKRYPRPNQLMLSEQKPKQSISLFL